MNTCIPKPASSVSELPEALAEDRSFFASRIIVNSNRRTKRIPRWWW